MCIFCCCFVLVNGDLLSAVFHSRFNGSWCVCVCVCVWVYGYNWLRLIDVVFFLVYR